MPQIHHEAILASAGSGKTFELAHRYIRLLALGEKAERIIALTFSRKAAAEIFDSIIKYLCEAIESPDNARKTAARLGLPSLGPADFQRLLQELLQSLHRVHIGTLDSFTIGILRAFPMELGVSTVFEIMEGEGPQARSAHQEVLGRIFSARSIARSAQRDFLEAFKQATYGLEEKSLERRLDAFVTAYRGIYQTLPSGEGWGNPRKIWPEGSVWLEPPLGDVAETADRLESILDEADLPEKVRRRWEKFLKAVRTFNVNSQWTREIEYLVEKLLEDLEGLRRGRACLRIERAECPLSAEASRLALELLTHVVRTELTAALEETRGIHRVLDQYERFYDETVRRQGKLTFTDVQYLLTPENRINGGTILTQNPHAEARLYIDYRLDCKLDHWLLDEFQDTSDLQWEALRNLADEVLQDNSGRRSFFFVGDVKQAIYGWRGGNARLFGKVLERYGERIRTRPLHTSYRSGSPIIETVNRAFGNIPDGLIPQDAAAEWKKLWHEHASAPESVPEHGYAAIIEPPRVEEGKPTAEDRFRAAAAVLKEIAPLSRGLSTAVLVRSNEAGKRLVNVLREECPEMTIVHEGRAAIKDNPVVSVLLSLAEFAAHPGDLFAWRHLQMSPLGGYFSQHSLARADIPLMLLGEIEVGGFQSFVRRWGARLDSVQPLDPFGRQRLRDLTDAAAEFDATGSRDVNDFLRFIDNYVIHDPGMENAIRVMTIHQAKGLGFDLVILPDLQGRALTDLGNSNLFVFRDPATNSPRWVLRMPRTFIALADPVLAASLDSAHADACFDSLCLLYVALTRAKRGLYIITSFPGKNSQTVDAAAFLKACLATKEIPISLGGGEFTCLYECGERNWYTFASLETPLPPKAVPALSDEFASQPCRRVRLQRIVPSEEIEGERFADELFSESYYRRLKLGTAIHELFERVHWLEQMDIEALVEEWRRATAIEAEFRSEAEERFRRALESEAIRKALSRPEGKVDLWRERRFEVVLGDRWITGAFDRVVIERDRDGSVARATIMDFKTDEITGEAALRQMAERYRPQLYLYREALARILAIEPSRIALRLVFTHAGRVIPLPFSGARMPP